MSGASETHENKNAGVTEMVVVVRFLLGPDGNIPEFLNAATNGLMAQLPSWCSGRYRTQPEISATESSMGDYANIAAGKLWNPTNPQEGLFVVRWQLDSECANQLLNGGHTAAAIRSALVSAWRSSHIFESKASADQADGLFYEVEDDDDYVDNVEEAEYNSGKDDEKKSAANREITFTIQTPNHVSFLTAKNKGTDDDEEEPMAHFLHRSCLRQYQTMLDDKGDEEEGSDDTHRRSWQAATTQEPTDVDEIEEMLDDL